jgi:gamma-glutamylcyclotransferase (GGCT)/AIG2-like uncharacterized protein YtfP
VPRLFSYGSLRLGDVQLATFGRLLGGHPDLIESFELVAPTTGSPHANVVPSATPGSRVAGMVFHVTDSELVAADEYERRDGYVRVSVRLASGSEAWVYVDARSVQGRNDGRT